MLKLSLYFSSVAVIVFVMEASVQLGSFASLREREREREKEREEKV